MFPIVYYFEAVVSVLAHGQPSELKVVTDRNHGMINDHNPLMSTFWQANTDLQCIVDPKACVEYCCKYSTKGEKASEAVDKLITEVTAWGDDDANSKKMLRRLMIKANGKRDWSKAEASGLVLQIPLVHSSHNFIMVNLLGGRHVKLRAEDGEQLEDDADATTKSILDHYAERYKDHPPALQGNYDMSLSDFCRKFLIGRKAPFKGILKPREKRDRCCPRFYPKLCIRIKLKY